MDARKSSQSITQGSVGQDLRSYIRSSGLLLNAAKSINTDKSEVYHFTNQEYVEILEAASKFSVTTTKTLFEFNDLLDPGIHCSFYRITENGEAILLQENLSPAKKEKATAQKAKAYSNVASDAQKAYESIKSELESNYKTQLENGDITAAHIHALALTLSRVPADSYEKHRDEIKKRTASRLYDWAKVHSSIVYPYLSLSEAANRLKDKDTYVPTALWGFQKDRIVLPKVESLDSDSTNWGLIYDILQSLNTGKTIEMIAENDSSVPDISETRLSKDPQVGYVLVRILELMKSPKSATLRRGEQASEPNSFVRNCVDFYVLDKVRQKFENDYSHLTYFPSVGSLRRQVKSPVETVDRKGVKTTRERITFVGYKLSELLCSYLVSRTVKVPENEPVSRFFFSLLDYIVDRWDADDCLPSSLFLPANTAVRRKLRQGPLIENKKTGVTKVNLYIPFSFVKSSECARMPEPIKKQLTSLGSSVLTKLDTINSFGVKDQNLYVTEYEQYITYCYALSDEVRKRWRSDLKVPTNIGPVGQTLIDEFPEDFSVLDLEACEKYLNSVRRLKFNFKVFSDDSEEVKAAQADISKANESRKNARKQRST
jgi:hypothetical protein